MVRPAGDPVDTGGALGPREIRAVAGLATKQAPADLLDRLFAGELATAALDGTMLDDDLCLAPPVPMPNAIGVRPNEVEQIKRSPGSSGSGSQPAEAFVFLWSHTGRREPN